MTNRLPLIVNAGAGQIEELAASDNLSLGNSSIVDANVVSATYLSGDGSNITNLPAGNYSNANVANYLPTYTGNLSSLTGNVTTTGNIQGNYILGDGSQLTNLPAGDYSNANVDSHLDGSAGNIIPVGNNAQSLGNATNQWSDLWVSNSTIYMNSVPITLGAGNVLTVNGEALLSNDSDTSITTTGNITAGNVTVASNSLTWPNASIVQTSASDFSITGDGQVTVRSLDGTYQWTFDDAGALTAPGNVNTSANVSANYFIGDGSQLTNLPGGGLPIANGTSNFDIVTANGNATVTANGTHTWTFDTNSNLSLPTNGSINLNGGEIWQKLDQNLVIRVQDGEDDGFSVYTQVDDGDNAVFGETILQRDQFQINFPVGGTNFDFNSSGLAVFPGDIQGPFGSEMNITIPGAAANSFVTLRTVDNTETLRSNVTVGLDNVAVSTNNVAYTWTFDSTGNLNTPQGGYIGAAGIKGDGTMLTGGTGNITSVTSYYANALGIYSSCLTANPDGTLNITTYGNGTGLAGQWTFDNNSFTAPGNIDTIANVQANYFIGNGSQLTGIVSSYGDSNVANYLPTYTGNLTSLTGDVTTTGNIQGLSGNITNLVSLNFDVENISARGNAGVNIGAGGNNNLVVLETGVLIQNVPLTVNSNVSANYFIGDGSQLTNLPVQPGTYSNANVANYLPTYSGNLPSLTGNITTTANVSGNYFIGNGSQLTNVVDSLVQPNNLLYVAKNGNDSTGTGSINAPYLTIQAAINAAAGDTATTIILAPGSYVENLTIANVANSLNITGSGLSESTVNGNITISGTSNNIEFDNFRVGTGRVTHSADGYWSVLNMRFSANTGITKTSNSIIKIFNTDLGGAGTGNLLLQAGRTNIYGSQVFNAQISGANTEVNFLHCDTVIIPTVISGNVNFVDSVILSTGTGNSLNALGGYVVLKNCLSITPTRVYAPINFGAGSSFSYGDSGFDFANTTFAGTAIVQPGQFQAINVRGGNVTTTANVNGNNITATGNVTANVVTAQQQLVLPTYANTTAANTAIGLANLVAGSAIFTTDSPPTFYGWDGTAWVALS